MKISAIKSISRQKPDKALVSLKKMLREKSPALRYATISALRKFVDEDGVLEILKDTAKNDKNVDVRKNAVYVIARSDKKEAVAILKQLTQK